MTAPTYEEARQALRARLGDRALEHSEAVADTAARLAEGYGVDIEAARLAGLLHDWCKETAHDELLAAAMRFGIPVTIVDESRPYLLHGPVGAAELEEEFPGLNADVLRAIRVHTFGAEEMTDLDRVVYVADMIEPGRHYHGVDELRAGAGTEPLSDLMEAAYARSIAHLLRKRKPLHPRTLAVWNHLVARDASEVGAP